MLSIVLVALCARELGGGFRSQLARLASRSRSRRIGLGLGVLFHPTMLDVPVWVAFSYVALRILGRPEPRLYPLLGLVAGIGLETKDTVIALLGVFLRRAAAARAARRPARSARVARPGDRRRLRRAEPRPGRSRTDGRASRSSGSQAARTAERHPARHLHRRAAGVPGRSAPARGGGRRRRSGGEPPLRALGRARAGRRPRSTSSSRGAATTRCPPWRSRSRPGRVSAVAGSAGPGAASRWSFRSLRCTPSCSRSWRRGLAGALGAYDGRARRLARQLLQGRDRLARAGATRPPERGARSRRPNDATRRCSPRTTARPGRSRCTARAGPADAPQRPPLVPVLAPRAACPSTTCSRSASTTAELDRLCRAWHVVARIDNRWRLGNEERGRTIARCTLRGTLGELWSSRIATDQL